MAGLVEVDPYLMRAARLERRLDEARAVERLDEAHVRDRFLAGRIVAGAAEAVAAIAHEPRSEHALTGKRARHEREVAALDGVPFEQLLEPRLHGNGAGHEE